MNKNTIENIENDLKCNITIVDDNENFNSYNLYYEDIEIYFEVEFLEDDLIEVTVIYEDCEQLEEDIELSDIKGILKDIIDNWEY